MLVSYHVSSPDLPHLVAAMVSNNQHHVPPTTVRLPAVPRMAKFEDTQRRQQTLATETHALGRDTVVLGLQILAMGHGVLKAPVWFWPFALDYCCVGQSEHLEGLAGASAGLDPLLHRPLHVM